MLEMPHRDHNYTDVATRQIKINEYAYQNKMETLFFLQIMLVSILIVGMCDDSVLYIIYEFLKVLLINEYSKINQVNVHNMILKDKKRKIRKKSIVVNV